MPTIGSISHGTMRSEDLIDAFAWELKHCATKEAPLSLDHAKLLGEADAWLSVDTDAEDFDADQHEQDGSDLVEEFFDALNEYAPPYCYFGANEGDGSDYGFWPSIDQMEEDARSGELLKVNDLSEVPAGYNGQVMLVNDHGNVTLYAPKIAYVEVWGCV